MTIPESTFPSQDLSMCHICRGVIDDPAHLRLGDLIAHAYCREYVKETNRASFEAGRMHERHSVAAWFRDTTNPSASRLHRENAKLIERGEHVS